MTSRERMILAMRNKKPDKVPCCPDISIMIPLKLKERPFWEFFEYEESQKKYYAMETKKLMYAYKDAIDYFGMDGWAFYAAPKVKSKEVNYEYKILEKTEDKIISRTIMHTPEGDLFSDTLFPKYNPPWVIKKYIKDFKKEFKFLKYFYPVIEDIDYSDVLEMKNLFGSSAIIGIPILIPSLIHLDQIADGGLAVLGLLIYDYPDLIIKYKEMHEEWTEKYLKQIISSDLFDEVLIGASGLITWQGIPITKKLSLDSIKSITKICKNNNKISHLHCCGFSMDLIKICAEQTDLNIIEPLEKPPQGDCNLKEIKQMFGNKIALKGNLHTSIDMLGSEVNLEKAAIKCIEDAAENGGYILSTGDQCGRDTPLKNIFKMIEVCNKYGKY